MYFAFISSSVLRNVISSLICLVLFSQRYFEGAERFFLKGGSLSAFAEDKRIACGLSIYTVGGSGVILKEYEGVESIFVARPKEGETVGGGIV